jgi:hypothetical protein
MDLYVIDDMRMKSQQVSVSAIARSLSFFMPEVCGAV